MATLKTRSEFADMCLVPTPTELNLLRVGLQAVPHTILPSPAIKTLSTGPLTYAPV